MDAVLAADNYLSVSQIDLNDKPAAEEDPGQGAHQAAAPRPLGNHPGSEVHLCPPVSADNAIRPDIIHATAPGAAREGSPSVYRHFAVRYFMGSTEIAKASS